MTTTQVQPENERLTAAQTRLDEARAETERLVESLEAARVVAIHASLEARDLQHCHEQGLLSERDPRFTKVCESRDAAVAQFRETEAAYEHAKHEAIEAGRSLEIESNRPMLEKRVQAEEAELERLRKMGERSGEMPASLGEIARTKWEIQQARAALQPPVAAQ